MTRLGRAGAVTCLLTVGGSALYAFQQTPQRPVFKSSIETVQVDVVVRDRDGLPVHGLTADDFIVLDRRKPQQISTFKAVKGDENEMPSFASHFPPATKLDVSSNKVSDARRLVVIVLDDLHAYRGRDDVVKRIAGNLVDKLGSDTLVALLMTSGAYNVEITDDRGRIMAGIDRFKGARLVRRPMMPVDDRRPSPNFEADHNPGVDLQEFDANLKMYATLEQGARLFSASDGRRKAFVLISESIAMNISGVVQGVDVQPDAPQGSEAYLAGNLAAMNPVVRPRVHELAVLDALKSMRQSNVVTYAIDPRGEINARDMLLECQPSFGRTPDASSTRMEADPCAGDESKDGPPSMTNWIRLAQNGLKQFAEASGGLAVINSSDFDAGVARITDDLDNYYLLGFNTDDTKSTGIRRLDVQVRNHPEFQLRYRRGYEIAGTPDAPASKNPFSGLVSGALPTSAIPLRITAAALPGSKSDARVHVAMEVSVPRQSVEEADRSVRDEIRYLLTVIDMRGAKIKETTGSGGRLALVPSGVGGPPPDVITYQISALLNLPPGRYHLRAATLSTKLNAGGSVYLPLDVPDFKKEELGLSAFLVGYGVGAKVPTIVGLDRSPSVRGPFGVPLMPTLDREFLTTDDVVLYFEVIRKERTRAVILDLRVIDRDENVVQHYEQMCWPSSAGKVSVRIPLTLVGTGAFRLRVHATDGKNETASEVPIVIK